MKQQIILQLVASIFAVFALTRAYLRFKERKLSSFSFIFWMAIWLLSIIAIFFPDISSEVARIVGIGRGADVIIYASIGVLYYLLFRILVKIEEINREVTELTRKIALKDIKKKNKRKNI